MGKTLIVSLALILGLNFLSLYYHLYPTIFWLDSLLHFLGGIWVAAFFFWFFTEEKIKIPNFLLKTVLAVAFVALIGVLWEFAEATFLNSLMAKIFGAQEVAASLSDTLSDLAFDLVGGLALTAAYMSYRTYKSHRSYISR